MPTDPVDDLATRRHKRRRPWGPFFTGIVLAVVLAVGSGDAAINVGGWLGWVIGAATAILSLLFVGASIYGFVHDTEA